MNFPILMHPSCILDNTTVGIYSGRRRLRHFLGLTTGMSGGRPMIIDRFVRRTGRIRVSTITRGNRVITCTVDRRVRCTKIRSNSTAVRFPPRGLCIRAIHHVGHVSHRVTGRLGVSNPFGVRCLTGSGSVGIVRYGLHTSHDFPFIDGILGVGFVRLTAGIVLKLPIRGPGGGLFRLSCINVGTDRFSFGHLRGTSPMLKMSVTSANRMNYVNASASYTMLGTVLSIKCHVPRGDILLSANGTGRGTSALRTTHVLRGGNCGLCTAKNSSRFLARGKIRGAHIC